MKIAELFVELGVKGTGEASKALSGLKDGLTDVASKATLVAAGITAAIYGFKELTSQSNQAGQQLNQFGNLTGLSTDRLQRWQYLARQSGVAADEMQSSIQGVQQAMTKMVLGQGAPAGIEALKNLVGFDPAKARDTFYVLDKLRDYAQKTRNTPDVANSILGSFGLSDKSIQALRTSTVDLNKISPSRLYSTKDIAALNGMSIAWSNLGDKIQKAIGHLNVQFGPQLVRDITKFTTEVVKLATAFGMLEKQIHAIEGLGKVLGWFTTTAKFAEEIVNPKTRGLALPNLKDVTNSFRDLVIGPPPASASATGNRQTSNVINTTVNVSGDSASDIGAEVSKHVGKMLNDSFRQQNQAGGF